MLVAPQALNRASSRRFLF